MLGKGASKRGELFALWGDLNTVYFLIEKDIEKFNSIRIEFVEILFVYLATLLTLTPLTSIWELC